jgi:acetoin utilization protein AcuB
MLVRDWMTRAVVTIPPSMSIAEAAVAMEQHRVRRLPVANPTGEGRVLAGIVSLLDVTRAFPPDVNPRSVAALDSGPRAPVSTIMTRDVVTVEADTPLEDAAMLLATRKIGALPVVAGARLIGIITESDIFRALLEALGAGRGLRVTFDLSRADDPVPFVADLAGRHDMEVRSVITLDREGGRIGVVRLSGARSEAFVEALWKSGHRVLSVSRSD